MRGVARITNTLGGDVIVRAALNPVFVAALGRRVAVTLQTHRFRRLRDRRAGPDGKEGVPGSSPGEGFA
jgi:hypothetical protein